MILKCLITYEPIIEQAARQTSVDFQAFRVSNPSADTVYDDFTMSPDDFAECRDQLRGHITDTLYVYLARYVKEIFRDNPRDMYISFDLQDEAEKCIVESMIGDVLKYGLLSWWYALRSQPHMIHYTQQHISTLEKLNGIVRPKVVYTTGSYY